MKFIHTSDWHIGRQFHNVSLLEDQRHVLSQIIDYIQSENADVLVIAGDIYDRSIPPAAAVDLLDEVLNQVCNEMNVPVIIISGNHDSAERLRFGARQLKQAGLHIIGDINAITDPVVIKSKSGLLVNFYGIPYHDPEQVRHHYDTPVRNHDEAHSLLVDTIKQSIPLPSPATEANKSENSVNVLLSHCFVDGAEESESERPLSIGGADRVSYTPMTDFNYVALGHLHSPQYRGEPYIRYSGSILKYSFSEQHQKKGVTLVELDDNGKAHITPLPLKPLRDMRVIEGALTDIIDNGKTDPDSDDYVMIRLTDTHAILDAMGKLRTVYPNVLHLEKPGIMAVGERKAMNREKLKRGELEMFQDFFDQVSGNSLSAEQYSALEAVIDSLHKQEEKQ
ncbi:exonuclease SbcCD subunit D [Alkalimarinus alittae]|uniref:Nuclease SbcCD subunit D n=1 Tax=Alkalimarinus alittae TaxID=2961619 RepID=A0ABY6MZU0_9ALTE|nr:exonuclease SbcCD subunit D [Alkalimarinus alittae]UZE95354.1 exonuclease SbcCD subunit D [Alkalimarinus alittae]